MFKYLIAIVIGVFFYGCASSGVVSKVSKFDNSKETELIPAWVFPNKMYIGMTHRNSKPDEIILKVGLSSYGTSGSIQEVAFSLDGTIIHAIPVKEVKEVEKNIKLTNVNCYTYMGVTTCQSGMNMNRKERLFIVPTTVPKKILEANVAYVRISSDGNNIEADLKNDGGNFMDLLPKFVEQLDK